MESIDQQRVKADIRTRSFRFAVRIVNLCRYLEREYNASNKVLANQLIRSGTSIGANIEEAQAAQSKADFASKVYIACKEARETNYWLRLLMATEVISSERTQDLRTESEEIVAILTTISRTAKQRSKA
ncbi:four helix bundle protein [Pelagicoccus mobilis]|uniref:Four helix bundle protein n=1 Tax=Pelagicoccus mobilis TaxID=415221 RepID=A0A934RZI0_9BACT|nr:four helix bundle protein [Pelagicoccus mobilis]MBK1880540.1 four helix bundle protein [Pelagicoccus mobilis]